MTLAFDYLRPQPTTNPVRRSSPAELYYGAGKGRWPQRRRIALDVALLKYPIVPYSEEMARLYGRVRAERDHAGRPISHADAWIATTAIFHGAPLATHDMDFQNIPRLQLITLDKSQPRTPTRPGPNTRPLPLEPPLRLQYVTPNARRIAHHSLTGR